MHFVQILPHSQVHLAKLILSSTISSYIVEDSVIALRALGASEEQDTFRDSNRITVNCVLEHGATITPHRAVSRAQ